MQRKEMENRSPPGLFCIRRALRGQFSVVQGQDSGCGFGYLAVVGDLDDGVALAVQFPEQGQNFLPGFGIQRAGGLVGQQDGRAGDQRPCDGDPLLLPARKLVGLVGFPLLQAHHFQNLLRFFPGALAVGAPDEQGHHLLSIQYSPQTFKKPQIRPVSYTTYYNVMVLAKQAPGRR